MRRTLTLLAAALATTAFAIPANAAPLATAPDRAPVATSHTQAATASEAAAVVAFWTPERMRSAAPLDVLTVDKPATLDVPAGEPRQIAPTAFPNSGSAWTGGGAVVATTGRVFFSYQGRTASCSGSAVTSRNESTVMTAGHCVKLGGAFHTNVVFVPAYNNGNAPYGTWAARATYATPQWVASEDINYDIGAAVMNTLGGATLTDTVGSQGIAFNQPRAQRMYAFGYPAAAPYNGSQLIYCSGNTFTAFLSNGIGMTCNMTGGASGGPWFQGFAESTGTGLINSVNSYKINFFPNWMFGPYFGADAQNVYSTAQNA